MRKSVVSHYADVQQGSDAWLQLRKNCDLTSSEFAAALGLNPYQSRIKLWKIKTGRCPPDEVNHHMQRGTEMEPHIATAYECASGRGLSNYGFVCAKVDGVVLGASPDRVDNFTNRLIEIKCPAQSRTEIPLYHLPQLLGQVSLMGKREVDYVSWAADQTDASGNMIIYVWRVSFDPQLWSLIQQQLLDFIDFVKKDKQPPRMNSAKKRQIAECFTTFTNYKKEFFL